MGSCLALLYQSLYRLTHRLSFAFWRYTPLLPMGSKGYTNIKSCGGGFASPPKGNNSKATLMGLIKKTVPTATSIQYTLDDITRPPLNVKQWMALEESSTDGAIAVPGTYVKAIGSARKFQLSDKLAKLRYCQYVKHNNKFKFK